MTKQELRDSIIFVVLLPPLFLFWFYVANFFLELR